VVPVVLVGLEAKPEDGQIRPPKLDSRYPAPVPRPTGTTLFVVLEATGSRLKDVRDRALLKTDQTGAG
jgi:hypothetical protein